VETIKKRDDRGQKESDDGGEVVLAAFHHHPFPPIAGTTLWSSSLPQEIFRRGKERRTKRMFKRSKRKNPNTKIGDEIPRGDPKKYLTPGPDSPRPLVLYIMGSEVLLRASTVDHGHVLQICLHSKCSSPLLIITHSPVRPLVSEGLRRSKL